MYTAILKLRSLLDIMDVPYQFKKLYNGFQLCYPESGKGSICSVIEHDGSYGHESNLLEIMGLLTEEESAFDEVKGYLQPEEVFLRIMTDWRGKNSE